MPKTCSYCGLEYPQDSTECLTCGLPAPTKRGFPNVLLAKRRKEQNELKNLYDRAIARAVRLNTIKRVRVFEQAVEDDARLVTACSYKKLSTFESDDAVFPTYQQLYHAKVIFAGDDVNNNERLVAEEATLPGCSKRIHFAVLAIEDVGINHYGNYSLVWKIDMVGHRASLFIANSLEWRRERGIGLDQPAPLGNRATWEDRHMLAVVKCLTSIKARTRASEFAKLLVRDRNAKDKYDVFIEAHIWGPLTRRSLAKVTRTSPDTPFVEKVHKIHIEHIADELRKIGVEVEGI